MWRWRKIHIYQNHTDTNLWMTSYQWTFTIHFICRDMNESFNLLGEQTTTFQQNMCTQDVYSSEREGISKWMIYRHGINETTTAEEKNRVEWVIACDKGIQNDEIYVNFRGVSSCQHEVLTNMCLSSKMHNCVNLFCFKQVIHKVWGTYITLLTKRRQKDGKANENEWSISEKMQRRDMIRIQMILCFLSNSWFLLWQIRSCFFHPLLYILMWILNAWSHWDYLMMHSRLNRLNKWIDSEDNAWTNESIHSNHYEREMTYG